MAKAKGKFKQRTATREDGTTVSLPSRNELHFHIQKTTRATVTRDKTKYTRKRKYKKSLDC